MLNYFVKSLEDPGVKANRSRKKIRRVRSFMLRSRSDSRSGVAVWHHSGGALRSDSADKHLGFAQ